MWTSRRMVKFKKGSSPAESKCQQNFVNFIHREPHSFTKSNTVPVQSVIISNSKTLLSNRRELTNRTRYKLLLNEIQSNNAHSWRSQRQHDHERSMSDHLTNLKLSQILSRAACCPIWFSMLTWNEQRLKQCVRLGCYLPFITDVR